MILISDVTKETESVPHPQASASGKLLCEQLPFAFAIWPTRNIGMSEWLIVGFKDQTYSVNLADVQLGSCQNRPSLRYGNILVAQSPYAWLVESYHPEHRCLVIFGCRLIGARLDPLILLRELPFLS